MESGPDRTESSDATRAMQADQPRNDPADVDLDRVERDLDGVEAALDRLADDTYWTDEVTGEPISAETLESDPTARRSR